ncbi:MAG: hypothetical protein ACTHO8_02950 [Solirubrobacterales bacterium]
MKSAKILGLAVVAALAATAIVGASSASAAFTKFNCAVKAGETCTLDGEMINGTKSPATFETEEGPITCTAGTAHAVMTGPEATAVETSPETGKESGVSYSGCTFLGFINVTVNMHNCEYNFHIGGTIDITPNACGPIDFTAGNCTVTVPSQSGLSSVTYENVSTKPTDIRIIPNITGITYTGSSGCAKPGTFTNGKYHGGTFTVRGTHPNGTFVNVSVS